MKQEKQTELLRTQQMLNEVNRKLLMTLGVAEVFHGSGNWQSIWYGLMPARRTILQDGRFFIMIRFRFL